VRHAFVVPRYGREVVGGAELGARLLAEHLVAAGRAEVEVFTTCALDHRTWADHYPAGTTVEEGVRVHRFPVRAGRHARFDRLAAEALTRPHEASDDVQDRFFERQGPVCPEAVDAAAASDADTVAFYPYLYHPTVTGVPRLGRRAVLHPAAHEEAPLHLPRFAEVFSAPGGLVFHTEAERRLVEQTFPATIGLPQLVLGLGVDGPEPGDPLEARRKLGLGERPYLLSLGRVEATKGSTLLARLFAAYKERRPGPLALVLAGPSGHEEAPPAHPDVLLPGRVADATKWGLLRGAAAVVVPSMLESFSFVVLEAWLAGVPVLVNAGCGPTREHCERSGGGLWFGSYAEFEVAVDRLLGDADLAATLAARGRAYTEEGFRWPVVVDRYARFLEALGVRSGA